MDAFNANIKKNHNCLLPILPNNGAKSQCSNAVTLKELNVCTYIVNNEYVSWE